MKTWEFARVDGSRIKISERLADAMGLVDGGFVYSTLFEYSDKGPKEYELILSMYPQENYRTLTHLTLYLQDVPGATAQVAKFLGERSINILNSVSLNAISDTVMIWKMLVDLSFAGESDLIKESFNEMKKGGDERVSKLDHIEVRPADIGRVFRTESAKNKKEVRRGAPTTLSNNVFDLDKEYGDLLSRFTDASVMIAADPSSWMVSVTFFKKNVNLVQMSLDIPDCPGSIEQVVSFMAGLGLNLISVFSKIKICYQTMSLEVVADLDPSGKSFDDVRKLIKENIVNMNGVFELKEYRKLE